jgi:hypothetical protein
LNFIIQNQESFERWAKKKICSISIYLSLYQVWNFFGALEVPCSYFTSLNHLNIWKIIGIKEKS